MEYTVGTTKESGWALFLFLAGFTVLGTTATGGGVLSFLVGIVLIGISFGIFKAVRAKEGA
jgi:hypothetical protein